MTAAQAAVLGAIQGLTEFLPVSSSAHILVATDILGWRDGGPAFGVALHWGTLLALLIAFRPLWLSLVRDAFARDTRTRAIARGAWLKLAAASVPAVVVGLLLEPAMETVLGSLPLQAAMLFTFGFLLWWVDRMSPHQHDLPVPGWSACMLMGLAQTLALMPGVSRSGVTVTAGRAMGLTRVAAARFSFIMAAPIAFAAGLLELRDVSAAVSPAALATGIVVSALVGLLAVRGLLRWLERAGFGAFFAYRTLLALVIVLHLFHR